MVQRHGRARRAALVALTAVLTTSAIVVAVVLWLQPSDLDDFYRADDGLLDGPAGTLIRLEPFSRGIPDDVDAWRVLYRSADADGRPSAISGLVLEPRAPHDGPRPLVAIAHGSTGVDQRCAPSLASRPLASLPGVREALDTGFAVAATDYLGLGTPGPHPYLIGSASAHAVLDSARSAAELVEVDPNAVALWGFSQGGHAALFAAEQATVYAPELRLRGVVTFAPATDLGRITDQTHGTLLGTLTVVSAAVAWSEAYDDLHLHDVVAPESAEAARAIAGRCLDPTSLPASTLQAIQLQDEVSPLRSPSTTHWARHLADNTPTGHLDVPLLVLQGAEDPLITPEITAEHVRMRCDAGDVVELRLISGAGHFTLASRTADDAAEWTRQRFAGAAARTTC